MRSTEVSRESEPTADAGLHATPRADLAQQPLFPSYRAFLVQFVRDEAGERITYQGRVEHVISGQSQCFESSEDLFAFMNDVLGASDESNKPS